MAAGQGFKTFTTGEVLTAGDVNGYLMQGINVFTNATARDAAITAPAEGQFAFTKDNNSLWYYDGAAWVASGATGDIEGVTATSPLTGGGTSGTVTVGIQDASTSQRGSVQLSDSISSTSTTLAATANAVKTTYDLAAASGLVLINTTTCSTVSSQSISNIFTSTYQNYVIYMEMVTSASTAVVFQLRTGATDANSNYRVQRFMSSGTGTTSDRDADTSNFNTMLNAMTTVNGTLSLFRPWQATPTGAIAEWAGIETTNAYILKGSGYHTATTSYDGLTIRPGSGTMTGTIRVYGVKN